MPWRSARVSAPLLRERRTIGFGPVQRLDADPPRRVGDTGEAFDPLRLGVGMGHADIISVAVAGVADREFALFAVRAPLEIGAFPSRRRAQGEQIMRHGGEA